MTTNPMEQSKEQASSPTQPVFSPEERKAIVAGFFKVYLSRGIEIKMFTSPDQIMEFTTGKPSPLEKIWVQKQQFYSAIATACGIGNPSQHEINSAIDTVFAFIVALRAGGMLKGEFLTTPDLEAEVKSLRERIENTDKLVLQLIEEVRILSHIRQPGNPDDR